MVGSPTRRWFHFIVGAALTVGTLIIGSLLPASLTAHQSWVIRAVLVAVALIVFTFYLRWQARSQEESPEAIKERVSQLEPELRKQVQIRSYGARSNLIEAPLRELDLDITPRLGWVRDPRLVEPEPVSEQIADDIVAAFESSKRRLLIVGEPGSGKTMAAYSLIEYLDETQGSAGRIPLLVNLSAWEAQETFEAFLVDYLCASVGYGVSERAGANAFIGSFRYNLILDGLDDIRTELRTHFSQRLDEFVRGLPGEVGVVVTCSTQQYEELLIAHSTGLGLVQAVEILPLTSQQLNRAFAELAELDEGWETFLSQGHDRAHQRVRDLLSIPLFLNLAMVGHLSPGQLLDSTTTEQELRDLVLDRYLDRTLADQREYEPGDARRYLSWIARFLNGAEVSPFGLKETDFTVFDPAYLTPPEPPKRYLLFEALVFGLILGLGHVLGLGVIEGGDLNFALVFGLGFGLVFGLAGGVVGGMAGGLFTWLQGGGPVLSVIFGLILGLVGAMVAKLLTLFEAQREHSAGSSNLALVWPPTKERTHNFLVGLGAGLGIFGLSLGLAELSWGGLLAGLEIGLVVGLIWGLGELLEPRSVLITSRTPKELRSRSLRAALVFGLVWGLIWGLIFGLVGLGLVFGLAGGVVVGLFWGLRKGGWFILLQKVAHRRLARAGNLPSRPYDFLEWGIEQQIFRRVGGGVRFRHNLIQQHLAKGSGGTNRS